MSKRYAHPAIGIIERIERMWTSDRDVAFDRAMIIVKELIDQKLLKGELFNEDPGGIDLAQRRAHFQFEQPREDCEVLRHVSLDGRVQEFKLKRGGPS